MEKVFLRVYNREIESMIEGGQLDEAVAHCQHILKTFPMHLETYRLLGKAFLEARRYADAADIFERVLMAVPDDFVSHVGMSIIRDDQGRLDDAIWHMERAFDVQPSNQAIQGELRRLFGRRDGAEPAKIRLSRDALANMYSQGELFNQAIAEIRSVLADDQDRPDLQVMLTRAYYRSGQKVEAAENAASLLKKYPYCMDALRVLVDVLPGTVRADNTQVYRHRLQLLDPYSSFASESVFSSDKVADSAVSIDHLDYKPGAMPASSRPDWASSIGIKFNNEKKSEPTPDWMQTPEAAGEPTAFSPATPEPEPAPAKNDAADAIPDWMRSAGWLDSSGVTPESSAVPGEEPAEEPIAKAEIPDWLMSMAPAAAEPEPQSEEPVEPLPVDEQGIPDWLKPMTPETPAGPEEGDTQPTPATKPAPSLDIPDFLKPALATETQGEVPVEPRAEYESDDAPDLSAWDNDETADSNLPAGNNQAEPEKPVEPQPAEDDNIPDWLKGLAPVGLAAEESVMAQEPGKQDQAQVEPPPTQPADDIDIPDWLKAISPPESSAALQLEGQPPVESQGPSSEDIPDWHNTLTPSGDPGKAPVEPELPAEPKAKNMASAIPDWLASLAPAQPDTVEAQEPPIPVEPQTPSEPQMGSAESNVPDWLSSLAPEKAVEEGTTAPQPQVEPQPESMENLVPDWLSSLKAAEPAPEEPKEPQLPNEPQAESTEGNVSDWLSSQAPAEAAAGEINTAQPPLEPEAEKFESGVPDWLASLGQPEAPVEKQEEPALPLPAEPLAQSQDSGIPDWLASLGQSEAPVEKQEEPPLSLPTEPQAQNQDSGVPDWLSSLGSSEAPGGEQPEAQASQPLQPEEEENIPDWLKQIRRKQAESEQFAEPGSALEQETPGAPGSMAAAETAPESISTPEPEHSAAPGSDSMNEMLPVTPPTEGAEAFPDFLTGMGARAAAAAAAASEELNQLKPSEQPASPAPILPEPTFQEPVTDHKPSLPGGDEAFKPSGEVKPLNIEDDAMAWLESLAAKQGAKPEELLTKPQDRSVDMPDWLRRPDEAQAEPGVTAAPLPPEVKRSLPETLPLEPLGRLSRPAPAIPGQPGEKAMSAQTAQGPVGEKQEEVIPPAVPPVANDEDTLAWLEQLPESEVVKPSDQTVGLESTPEPGIDWMQLEAPEAPKAPEVREERVAPEAPVVPEAPEGQETQELSDTQPVAARRNAVVPTMPEPSGQEIVPPALEFTAQEVVPTLPLSEPEEVAPAALEAEPEEGDSTITSWLSKLDVEEALGKKSAEAAAEAHPAESTEELPDWLKDLEKPAAVESTQPNEDLPDWLRQPLQLDQSQTGSEPATPTWVDENVPVDEQAIRTVPEEWVPADAKPTEQPYTGPESIQEDEISPESKPSPAQENIPPAETVPQPEPVYFTSQPPVVHPTLKQTGMLSLIPSQDKDAELLSNAQTVLDQNSLNESMKLYSKLVKKGRLLDEVIHDLRQAIYRYPVDVIIWQTLGDAYMRANRLQDALDAYTKAEELLR